jgi:polysaccharide export outer membrane protein
MFKRCLLVVLAAFLVSACVSGADLPPLPESSAGPYRLDTGDQIRLIVFGQPDLSGEFTVNDNGNISIPLLGPVQARGLSTADLESEVVTALSRDLLVNPSVSVEIQKFRPVFILGEVASPGQYDYTPGMTVLTAVTVAGGFTFRAVEDYVSITRRTGDAAVEGRAERETLVQPGDVIFVYERYF